VGLIALVLVVVGLTDSFRLWSGDELDRGSRSPR